MSELPEPLNGERPAGLPCSDLLVAFRRVWAMPNSETFSVPAIGNFVRRYLDHSKESVDCFARNKRWAKWTNDLNPKTAAEYHMDVMDFLRMLRAKGVKADCVIFDPPYSPRQVKECYEAIGENCKQWMIQRQCGWTKERKLIREILAPGGVVLSFGWNTVGMGKGFALEEILLVCHGGGHNDTICIAERALNAPNDQAEARGTAASENQKPL